MVTSILAADKYLSTNILFQFHRCKGSDIGFI